MQRSLHIPMIAALTAVGALLLSPIPSTAETTADIVTPPADAEKLPSGLVTKVLQEGTGEDSPDANDIVQAHYIGRTPEGEVFLSTYDSGQPGTFPLDKVFAGWSEGMKLMVVGEKRRLWIPDHLGPKNPSKGPEGAAIFDVELLGFLNMPNPPESLAKPPPEARELPSGASVLTVEKGTGENYPGPDDVVVVHYVQWDAEGNQLDATYARNRPVGIPLDKVLPAFAEAVSDMVEGEHRFVWLPRRIHDMQWPKAPDGMMVLRVHMVRLMPASALESKTPDLPKKDASGG